jgi:4-aminobutyrate aminotransferase-like enzyme
MRAGLATLDVLERESLGGRALAMGDRLRARLRQELARASNLVASVFMEQAVR